MPPITPSNARSLMDNGALVALAIVALWGFALALLLAYKWANNKLSLPVIQEPSAPKCAECVLGDEFRRPEDLVAHRLFGYMRLALVTRIPNLPISDPGRRLVFTDLLEIIFQVVSSKYLEWLRRNIKLIHDMRTDALASEQLSLVGEIVEEYERQAENYGIPAVVLDRFRYWNGPRLEHLRAEITLVCESEWIDGSTERIGYLLSVVEQLMKATMFDAERTLTNLNGSLTGINYKGVMVGPCTTRGASGEFAAIRASQT